MPLPVGSRPLPTSTETQLSSRGATNYGNFSSPSSHGSPSNLSPRPAAANRHQQLASSSSSSSSKPKTPLEEAAAQEKQSYIKRMGLKFERLKKLYNDPELKGMRGLKTYQQDKFGNKMCWLCIKKNGHVFLHGIYVLCYECVKDVLLSLQVPKLQRLFHPIDALNVTSVQNYVETAAQRGEPALTPAASPAIGKNKMKREWNCPKCTFANSDFDEYCQMCDTAKPDEAVLTSAVTDSAVPGVNMGDVHKERERVNEIELHRERLKIRLSEMGMVDQNISDDGNCLFRALALQFLRDENLYPLFRELVCEYMKENKEAYLPYMGEDGLKQYLKEMEQDKFWGDEFTLQAASKLFFTTIHVITSEKSRWHLKYKPFSLPKGGLEGAEWERVKPRGEGLAQIDEVSQIYTDNSRQIFLAYVSPVHYYSFTNPDGPQITGVELEKVLAADGTFPSAQGISSSSTTGSQQPQQQQHLARMSPTASLHPQLELVKPKRIAEIRDPIVVMLGLQNNRYIGIEKGAGSQFQSLARLTVGHEAAKFYLHAIGRHNEFILQCVHSGLFVTAPKNMVDMTRRGHPRPLGLAKLPEDMFHKPDLTNFKLFVDYDTKAMSFQRCLPKILYIYYDIAGAEGKAIASENQPVIPFSLSSPSRSPGGTADEPRPIEIIAPHGQKRERLCTKCRQWFNLDTAASSSSCRHLSHCEEFIAKLNTCR